MDVVCEHAFGVIPLSHVGDRWSVFLILHKHGQHWGFPKGKGEPGEDSKGSAIRELKEETGLQVEKFLVDQPIVEEYTFLRKGKRVEKTVHYYPAIVSGALILQPEEIRDGKWTTLEEAPMQLTFAEARNVLAKVEQLLA